MREPKGGLVYEKENIIISYGGMHAALLLPAGATAMEQGDARVTIGADLDAEERTKVYADFGIEPGDAIEITVTNADERAYLEGIAPEKKIGKVALSCTYIVIGEPGSGLQITTKHINWCTSEMYINALTTAGITDAKVIGHRAV